MPPWLRNHSSTSTRATRPVTRTETEVRVRWTEHSQRMPGDGSIQPCAMTGEAKARAATAVIRIRMVSSCGGLTQRTTEGGRLAHGGKGQGSGSYARTPLTPDPRLLTPSCLEFLQRLLGAL